MKSGWLSIMVRGAHPTLTLNFELFGTDIALSRIRFAWTRNEGKFDFFVAVCAIMPSTRQFGQ